MNRRHLFSAAAGSIAAVALPALATASTSTSRIDALREKIAAAAIFYEDHIAYDNYEPYFHGVLAAQGLKDWAVSTDKTGKAGILVDIAVQFHEEPSTFYYISVRYSEDYWQRNNRLKELRNFKE